MVTYEVDPPRATITIDDPERRNPLSAAVISALSEAVSQAASDPGVRVIVVTGRGDRVFSAGGDLAQGFVDSPEAVERSGVALSELLLALRRCGKPTVARVNGHALAGGFGLAAACDVVIAAEGANFGTPEIGVGLWPMVVTAVLQRVVPHKALLELMMTGRPISAEEARHLGVVSRVVSAAELDPAVDEVVEELASKSAAVLALGKSAFYAVEDLEFEPALEALRRGLMEVTETEDAREGVAAFLEKRAPRWKDR